MRAFFILALAIFAQNASFAQDSTLISRQTMQGLRKARTAASPERSLYITDAGKQGFMAYDPQDNNSLDDGAMTIVTASGMRYKRIIEGGIINAHWFGVTGNGAADDWQPLQKAIDYILSNPNSAGRTLYLPPGNYKISKPLLIAKLQDGEFKQTSINIVGPANSKSLGAGYATILPDFNNTFAIGIQHGKGILIKDLQIKGKFSLPSRLSPVQVDTLPATAWSDGSTRDNPITPYSGIVIDPFSDAAVFTNRADMYPGLEAWYPSPLSRSGSSAVQITGCAINFFIVGVMLTPSNQQNADLIDVIDCDISYNRVAYAMGQAQSKECHVDRLKCWGNTHTVFDNMGYGFRHGDGANIPMVDGVNIAGNVKQLCRIYAGSFNGNFRNVYAEGLFRIGYVGGPATIAFQDCQFNFSTLGPNMPYPDFYVLGSGLTFHDCMLRLYTGNNDMRLVLSGSNAVYQGGAMNNPPVSVNINNNHSFENPRFSNVLMYYSGGILGSNNYSAADMPSSFLAYNGMRNDPVYFGNTYIYQNIDNHADITYKLSYNDTYERTVLLSGVPVIHVDPASFTGWFKSLGKADLNILKEGDFLLTSEINYQDQFTNIRAATYPVGFIKKIAHDTIYLSNLAHGIHDGMSLPLWLDYYVMAYPPFTGNIAEGSNTITQAQGILPAVGERPDLPMVATGTLVKAVDTRTGQIRLSNVNSSGQSFSDFTFMNGYPSVEMYSAFDFPELLQAKKTFIGGAHFYRYKTKFSNAHVRQYPMNGNFYDEFRILNTVISGDTSLHKLRYLPRQ